MRVATRKDVELRPLEPAADLRAALVASNVGAAFDAMSCSHRKEWLSAIADAKRPETRAKRIGECVRAMEMRILRKDTRRKPSQQ